MERLSERAGRVEALPVAVAPVVDDRAGGLVVAAPLDVPVTVEVVAAGVVADRQIVVRLGHLLHADVSRTCQPHRPKRDS